MPTISMTTTMSSSDFKEHIILVKRGNYMVLAVETCINFAIIDLAIIMLLKLMI